MYQNNGNFQQPFNGFQQGNMVQGQMQVFQPGMVPTIPCNYVPYFNQIAPIISAMVANEVARCAQQNNARNYYYNIVTAGNFNNQEFAKLITAIYDILELEARAANVMSNNITQQFLSNVINNVVAFFTAYTALNTPQVAQTLTQQMYGEMVDLVNRFSNKFNQVQLMRNQTMQQQTPQWGQPAINNGWNNQNQFTNNMATNQNMVPMNSNMFGGGSVAPSSPVPGTTNAFQKDYSSIQRPRVIDVTPAPSVQQNTDSSHVTVQVFSNRSSNAQQKNVPATQQIPQQVEIQPNEVIYDAEPIPLTYDSKTHKRVEEIKREGNGTLMRRYKYVPLTQEEIMDRSQHTTSYVEMVASSLIPPEHITRADTVISVLSTKPVEVQVAANAPADGSSNENNESSASVETTGVLLNGNLTECKEMTLVYDIETGLDEALGHHVLSKPASDKINSTLTQVCLTQRFYALESQDALFTALAAANNFDDIHATLSVLSEQTNNQVASILLVKLDKYFTKEYVRFLRSVLNIDILFDSFIHDFVDVKSMLETISSIKRARYAANQSGYVKRVVCSNKEIEEILMEEQDGSTGKCHYLTSNYLICNVDVLSTELNLSDDVTKNASKLGLPEIVSATTHSFLAGFIKNIFNSNTYKRLSYNQVLLVTTDDVVFSVGKNTYDFSPEPSFTITRFIK